MFRAETLCVVAEGRCKLCPPDFMLPPADRVICGADLSDSATPRPPDNQVPRPCRPPELLLVREETIDFGARRERFSRGDCSEVVWCFPLPLPLPLPPPEPPLPPPPPSCAEPDEFELFGKLSKRRSLFASNGEYLFCPIRGSVDGTGLLSGEAVSTWGNATFGSSDCLETTAGGVFEAKRCDVVALDSGRR